MQVRTDSGIPWIGTSKYKVKGDDSFYPFSFGGWGGDESESRVVNKFIYVPSIIHVNTLDRSPD